MKYLFLFLLLLPLSAHAVPLVPKAAVNEADHTCFIFDPGNECGVSLLPEGWQSLDWGSCPSEYRVLSPEEQPTLAWRKSPTAPVHCGENKQSIAPVLFASLPGIIIGATIIFFWFRKRDVSHE